MKLIKTTDSKPESINSTRLKRYGLFECPVCKCYVERPLSHGKRNKSCGKKECRKATFTGSNTVFYTGKPIEINDQKIISRNKLRYFAGFRAWYNRLDGKYINPSIDTIEKAANELYVVYPLIVGVPIGPTNYKIESKYQHEIKSGVARAVERLNQDGEVVAEYSSVVEAAKAVDGIASKISAVCKGTRKTHAGFKWRYKE